MRKDLAYWLTKIAPAVNKAGIEYVKKKEKEKKKRG